MISRRNWLVGGVAVVVTWKLKALPSEPVSWFVLVICGEHTVAASNVNREFSIVQEQGKPYVLLWGRRSAACTPVPT